MGMTDDRKKIKVFITKYFLSSGKIEQREVEYSDQFPNMVTYTQNGFMLHCHGNDWHRTRAGAEKRAEEMLAKKLASIDKQRDKMLKLARQFELSIGRSD